MNAHHGESVDIGQMPGNGYHAVAVGIRFDNGHNPGPRGQRTNDIKIVFQRTEPDERSSTKTHG